MKQIRFAIICIFIFANLTAQASKIDFYIPPIIKLKLDPSTWILPYTTPLACNAMSYSGFRRTPIQNKLTHKRYFISFIYVPTDTLQIKSDLLSSMKKIPNVKPINNFEFYEEKKKLPSNKDVCLLDRSNPNLFVMIYTSCDFTDEAKIKEIREFVSGIRYVSPKEIDRLLGYPLDSSIDKTTLYNKRCEPDNIAQIDKIFIFDAKKKEQCILYDLQTHFSYEAYHKAMIRLAEKNFTEKEKAQFAFGMKTHLEGLFLIDALISLQKNESQYQSEWMKNYLTNNPEFMPYGFKNGNPLIVSDNAAWWILYGGSNFDIVYAELNKQGELSFQHHFGERQHWQQKYPLIIRDNFTLPQSLDLEYSNPEFLGKNKDILKLELASNLPSSNGLIKTGPTTYYIDLRHPEAPPVVFEPITIDGKYNLVYENELKIEDLSNDHHFIWENSNNELHFNVYQNRLPKDDWRYFPANLYFSRDTDLNEIYLMLDSISALQTLIIPKSEAVQMNNDGTFQIIRPYISNGQIVAGEILQITKDGMYQMSFDEKNKSSLYQSTSWELLKTESMENFTSFFNIPAPIKVKTYVDQITSETCQATRPIPTAFILKNYHKEPAYAATKQSMDKLMSFLQYPQSAKQKGIGGVVTVEITVDSDGTIKKSRAMNTIAGAPELSTEAVRLVTKLGKLDFYQGYPNLSTTLQIAIRFEP